MNRLAWVYGPTVFLFVLASTLVMMRYQITREKLHEIHAKLQSGP